MLKRHTRHPFFVFEGDELVLKDEHVRQRYEKLVVWLDDIWKWASNRCRVLQLLERGREAWEEHAKARGKKGGTSKRSRGQLKPHSTIYAEPLDEAWKDAWRVTERVLLTMRDEVKERGAQFFVVTLSNGIQVHPDPSVRQKYKLNLGVKDLFYPDRRIMALCKREGIPSLALASYLQRRATARKVFLHGFGTRQGKGHWNERGHRLAGERIAQWLCEFLKKSLRISGFQKVLRPDSHRD